MSKLVIFVPVGRRSAGRGVLLGRDGKIRLPPFRVVAIASASAAAAAGNTNRDWRKPYGDTPTGSYLVAGALPPGAEVLGSDGASARLGALVLLPNGGNALEALRAGRTRFLIHAGRPDAEGRLEATFGGLRVADADLATLLQAVNEANADGDALSSVEVEETTAPPWLEGDDDVPSSRGRAAKSRVPASGRSPVSRRVLAALGFGAASKGSRVAVPTRRAFVGLATVTFGLMAFACTGSDSVPGGDSGGGGGSGGGSGTTHDGAGTTTSATTTTGSTTTGGTTTGGTTGDTTTGDTTTGDTATTTGDTTTTTTTTSDTTTTTTTSDTTTTTTSDTTTTTSDTTTTTSDTTTTTTGDTTTGDTTTTTGDTTTTTGDTTTTTGDTTTTTGDTTTTTGDTTTTTGDTTTFFIKTPTLPQRRRGGPPPGGGTGT